MYLRNLLVQNCKLMAHLEVPFVQADGSPRLWTVFVGENGTCKTTLLRAIALATAGSAFANNLVNDPSAYLDRRRQGAHATVKASFGFSTSFHAEREYSKDAPRPSAPPGIDATVTIGPTSIDSSSRWSSVASDTAATSPIDDARNRDLSLWFAAGYGVGRVLNAPGGATEGGVPKRDRLRSLFDATHSPLGTGFSDRLALTSGDDRARAFALCLKKALIERMEVPKLRHIELRGQGGANNRLTLIEAHRFSMQVGSTDVKLPAIWLSQGYQAVIALVADIIGNVWLEAGAEVLLDDMEGIVLVDELDLHLHPTWQTTIVAGLRATFPRMQFIVTTHSPLVLAGCRTDEVWMLQQDEQTGDVTAKQGEVSPMLLTGSELNREFFGVERASPLSEDMRRYVELASNAYRSNEDDILIAELRGRLQDNDIAVDYEPVARKTAS